jgi:hypothetical protein
MKKENRKVKRLELHRETLIRFADQDVAKAKGQAGYECTGCDSGCGIFVNAVVS